MAGWKSYSSLSEWRVHESSTWKNDTHDSDHGFHRHTLSRCVFSSEIFGYTYWYDSFSINLLPEAQKPRRRERRLSFWMLSRRNSLVIWTKIGPASFYNFVMRLGTSTPAVQRSLPLSPSHLFFDVYFPLLSLLILNCLSFQQCTDGNLLTKSYERKREPCWKNCTAVWLRIEDDGSLHFPPLIPVCTHERFEMVHLKRRCESLFRLRQISPFFRLSRYFVVALRTIGLLLLLRAIKLLSTVRSYYRGRCKRNYERSLLPGSPESDKARGFRDSSLPSNNNCAQEMCMISNWR